VQICGEKKTNLHEDQQHHPITPVTVHVTTVHDVSVLLHHKFFSKKIKNRTKQNSLIFNQHNKWKRNEISAVT
jgi:hypothetical protein